jgi:trk system potassium uptake protein TrkA
VIPLQVVVIGCGRVGSAVAKRLSREGWSVSVVDEAVEAFARLGADFQGETFEGHALDTEVLELAGIGDAEACVVATNGDNTNLLTAQIVKRKYGVECTVVRVLDPGRAELYERLGLHTVCPTKRAIDTLADAVRACEVA